MVKKIEFGNHNTPHSADEKKKIIENATEHFSNFLTALGFSWQKDLHMEGTPKRVAKAFVNDLICGCYDDPPNITAFDNRDEYSGIVYSGKIPVTSLCSHHWLPFTGEAHVCYIPAPRGKVVGYSKLGRIVDWFARRPQVQENLTMQISEYVNKACEGNLGVGVFISCSHSCACNRGVKQNSVMMTSKLTGELLNDKSQSRFEFYKFIELSKKNN